MKATITRYKLFQRNTKFAWYWAYNVQLEGAPHANQFGRFPLAAIRRWCKQQGATEIAETWKPDPQSERP